MLASSPIPKQTVGRTFFIAIIVLGVVAMLQLGAVSWAFIARVHSAAPSRQTQIAMRGLPTSSKPGQLNLSDNFAPQDTGPAAMPNPTPINQGTLIQPVSPTQGRQNELADQARTLRDRGDMSLALTRLREAQALSADNPHILSEMAITYEKMGLQSKATELWQRIYDMGEQAGAYYAVAKTKLAPPDAGSAADNASGKDTEGFQSGSVLALVDVVKTFMDDSGKRLKLKIPLKAHPGDKIDVHDVVIQVFFYDQVDDQNASIVQTNANVTSTWTTSPVDWSDNSIEILEVEYNGLPVNPKEKRAAESRRFFGYIVRVYYKGSLQDMRAEPVKLLKQYPPPVTLTSEDTQ